MVMYVQNFGGYSDEKFRQLGVEGNWYIQYNHSEKIISYSLIYSDGYYADYNTPIESFKKSLWDLLNYQLMDGILYKIKRYMNVKII